MNERSEAVAPLDIFLWIAFWLCVVATLLLNLRIVWNVLTLPRP